jgi:hypothetical protein
MAALSKAGWLIKVRTGQIRDMQTVYSRYLAGYGRGRLAEAAVHQYLSGRPRQAINVDRALSEAEITANRLRPRQVKYYVSNPHAK